MKTQKIKAKHVKAGDIIYVTSEQMEMNEHLLGPDVFLTGSDTIIIIDDSGDPYIWLINGGHEFYLNPKDNFQKLGHYSKLVDLNRKGFEAACKSLKQLGKTLN